MTNKPAHSVGIVTTSRADFSIYLPVIEALIAAPGLSPQLYVGGTHLSPAHGRTVTEIEELSGAPIAARIESLLSSDSEQGVSKSIGLTTSSFSQVFAASRPDLLLVLGDRFEMFAAVAAAAPFRLPVAHIHGGEETEGAFDNAFRHAITKLSHLHFPSTDLAASRIARMGENPRYVIRSGAPALDAILSRSRADRAELAERFGVPKDPFILVTYHPETLNPEQAESDFNSLLDALRADDRKIVLTGTNADVAGARVREIASAFIAQNEDRAVFVEHFGAHGYYGAMAEADLMVGNSSSGIIEAASLGLPVVNIGDRQAGREQSPNTVNAAADRDAIAAAIAQASTPAFKAASAKKHNVYGTGQAASIITDGIALFLADGAPVRKSFHGIAP